MMHELPMRGAPPLEERMLGTVTRIFSRRKTQTAAVATLAAISSVGLLPRDAFVAPAAVTKPAVYTKPVSPKPARTASTRPRTVVERLTSSTRATNGLPNLEHPRVDTWIKRFTTTQRGS